MMQTVEVTSEQLVEICREADEPYFGTAAELVPLFIGGFYSAEIAEDGWAIKLYDRGCNSRYRDTTFVVPVSARTAGAGPAKFCARRS